MTYNHGNIELNVKKFDDQAYLINYTSIILLSSFSSFALKFSNESLLRRELQAQMFKNCPQKRSNSKTK